MNRRRRQRAFTLVELLLAVMVTVMIAVSTVAMIRGADQTRRRADRQMALQQEVRAAVETMSAALRNSCRDGDRKVNLEGVDDDSDGLPADRIRFLTRTPHPVRFGQPESDVKECEFFLQEGEAGRPGMLMQRLDPTRNPEPDDGGVIRCVAENIVALELAYHDGKSWLPEWSPGKKGWPLAVRIHLLAVDPDDADTTWPAECIVNFPRLAGTMESEEDKPAENQEGRE
ncbi:MAG: prepilin-type N-terminal cleavage/methylation domain-containing protein [Phycisphaerae bacterium]|nr:prepilin-type N-terminal cleavage/methylation domain-containing protein [Phycisphaerae bacterium]